MGIPKISAIGLPGNRLDASLAGMIPITFIFMNLIFLILSFDYAPVCQDRVHQD
jgi:hypothetical protein